MTLKKHEYHQDNLKLKEQVARELKDNNGLRATIGKMTVERREIRDFALRNHLAELEDILMKHWSRE